MSVDSTMFGWPSVPAARASFMKRSIDVRVGRELGVQDLDRDAPLDQRVLGQEHRAHPALAERLDDPVPPLDDVPRLDHRFPRRMSPISLHR